MHIHVYLGLAQQQDSSKVFNISTSESYKIYIANHYTASDTISLIGTLYPEPLNLFFINNTQSDSTTIIIEDKPGKVFLAGKIIYGQTIKEGEDSFDLLEGRVICVVNRKPQDISLLVGKIFEDKENKETVYRMLILYEDKSAVDLTFY